MNTPREAYPLTWPTGRNRTPPGRRRQGRFKLSFGRVRNDLIHELELLGARDLILSSNLPTRMDGLPYADFREPADPGVAVYFQRKGTPFVLACDSYDRVTQNLRAIGVTAEALRTIQRHGASDMLEQAFTGFAALPPARATDPSWWEVLECDPRSPTTTIRAHFLQLAELHHPDKGGSTDKMQQLNRAYDKVREERGI